MNSENKCFSLLIVPPQTIFGVWPTEILYNSSPLSSPAAARHHGVRAWRLLPRL